MAIDPTDENKTRNFQNLCRSLYKEVLYSSLGIFFLIDKEREMVNSAAAAAMASKVHLRGCDYLKAVIINSSRNDFLHSQFHSPFSISR